MNLKIFLLCVMLTAAEEYFFSEIPPTVVNTGYAHVTISVNFSNTEKDIEALKYYRLIVKNLATESSMNKNDSFIEALNKVVEESVQIVSFEWSELKNLVGNEDKVTRFIATLGALAIGAAISGLGLFGLLQSQDVSELHQSVGHLEDRQDHIVTHIHHQDQRLKQHDLAIIDLNDQFRKLGSIMGGNVILTEMEAISLYVTTLKDRLLEQIRTLKNTIILAKYNKPNPDFISTKFLNNAMHKISSKLPNPYELISKNFIDWYHFETSMVLQSNGFFLALHAPYFNPSLVFKTYHFRSLPLHIQENSTFLYIKPETPIIGISNNKKYFIELSETELEKCKLISSKFICPHLNFLKKDFGKSCTYQLFLNEQKNAGKLCPTILSPRREIVFEISKNTFKFIFPTDKMVTQKCPNSSQTIPVYHKKTLTIPQHCHLETSSNLIFPTDSITVTSEITFYKIEMIHFETTNLPIGNNATIDLKQFESYQDVSKNYHVSHSKFNITLILSIIIIAVLFVITCVCMFKRVPASFPPQE